MKKKAQTIKKFSIQPLVTLFVKLSNHFSADVLHLLIVVNSLPDKIYELVCTSNSSQLISWCFLGGTADAHQEDVFVLVNRDTNDERKSFPTLSDEGQRRLLLC